MIFKSLILNTDVDTEYPDEKSIMTYVSMLFNTIPNVPIHPSDLKLESVSFTKKHDFSDFDIVVDLCFSLIIRKITSFTVKSR